MCKQPSSLEFSDPSVSWERLERKSISPHSSSFFQFFQVSHFFKNKSLFTEATYRTQDNHVSAMLQRTSKSEMGWITCTWSYGLFQDFRLFNEYTVFGNLELTLNITGGKIRDTEKRITDILKLLGIDRLFRRYPHELSGGEKQKVCMARAIINDPKILLADEPTGNLDPSSSEEIFKLLELIHRHGTTVVMATHDFKTADSLIQKGRMVSLDYI